MWCKLSCCQDVLIFQPRCHHRASCPLKLLGVRGASEAKVQRPNFSTMFGSPMPQFPLWPPSGPLSVGEFLPTGFAHGKAKCRAMQTRCLHLLTFCAASPSRAIVPVLVSHSDKTALHCTGLHWTTKQAWLSRGEDCQARQALQARVLMDAPSSQSRDSTWTPSLGALLSRSWGSWQAISLLPPAKSPS